MKQFVSYFCWCLCSHVIYHHSHRRRIYVESGYECWKYHKCETRGRRTHNIRFEMFYLKLFSSHCVIKELKQHSNLRHKQRYNAGLHAAKPGQTHGFSDPQLNQTAPCCPLVAGSMKCCWVFDAAETQASFLCPPHRFHIVSGGKDHHS